MKINYKWPCPIATLNYQRLNFALSDAANCSAVAIQNAPQTVIVKSLCGCNALPYHEYLQNSMCMYKNMF